MTEHTVSVGELARFCHRSGDIDMRFSASPTASEGTEGHQRLYKRRPADYQPEYPVEAEITVSEMPLTVRGRADGWHGATATVEEIKTCRTDPAGIPETVTRQHLAQGRLYAALIARAENLAQVQVRLCWYFLDRDQEYPLEQSYTAEELARFLEETLQRYGKHLSALMSLREQRDQSLRALGFPFATYRQGQREMAELSYRCIAQSGRLMLEAPTGIGKTQAVLFPALRALETGKHDSLLFCTARNTGKRAAESAIAQLKEQGMRAITLTLTARETVCFSPGKACRAEECSYALGFYDRLPDARAAALQQTSLARPDIESLAREHRVCPYYLAQELVPYADVIVSDLHGVFGLTAAVGTSESGQRRTALIDEAHNLPDRARDMYSASLLKSALMAARGQVQGALRKRLDAVNRQLLSLQKLQDFTGAQYRLDEPPAALVESLTGFTTSYMDALADDPGLNARAPAVLAFYFDVLQFQRVIECLGDDYCIRLLRGEGKQGLRVELVCLDPHRLLAQRHARLHSSIAFSATLSPFNWARLGLGLPEGTVYRQLSSPFDSSQLQVTLHTGIDTRWQARSRTLFDLASTLLEWLDATPGNCMVFFPSYAYMQDCLAQLEARLDTDRELWVQSRDQSQIERDAALNALRQQRNLVVFCLLGGVFAEGVDLPGDQLSSVVVIGLGMPQFNEATRELANYYDDTLGAGFDFTYRFPALQKVNQAMGRVVRTLRDRGSALLIDARYADPAYRSLLAPGWHYEVSTELASAPGD